MLSRLLDQSRMFVISSPEGNNRNVEATLSIFDDRMVFDVSVQPPHLYKDPSNTEAPLFYQGAIDESLSTETSGGAG